MSSVSRFGLGKSFGVCCCLALAGLTWPFVSIATAAEDVPDHLSVPPGFEISLVAARPLVERPVMASFDDRGRLYVADNTGENLNAEDLLQQLPNAIRQLEDTDGDGAFDRSTIFADGMTFPQGALWHRGAVYVASPPYIWRFIDADDDGVAEQRDILVGKFGFIGNAADIHGCFVGPEGRIYWTDGRHGHDLPPQEGRPASKGLAARIFSCRADGTDVRVHCGGGMDNPVELAFSESGDLFGTMTFYNPDDARHDALMHFVHGGVYPRKHPCVDEFPRTGELLPPLSLFDVVAPAGLVRYRSTAFGEEFTNNLFTAQFNPHKVVRHELIADGSTYRSRDSDFLVSTNPDFHPTDVLEDADGSLLVINTGGWFRIGCPTSQVAKPEILGAIYRIRRTDAPPQADPRGFAIPWPTLSLGQLAALLTDPRWAVRDRAVEECVTHGEPAVTHLEQVLNTAESTVARCAAARALCRIGSPPARLALRAATTQPDAAVRQLAAQSLGWLRSASTLPELIALLQDEQPHVRREAAAALGKIGSAEAVPALLAALAHPADRMEEHALLYALIELNQPALVRVGLADSLPQVRRGALIALDQMASGDLTQDDVLPLLDTADVVLQGAALDVIGRQEGWAAEIVDLLQTWLNDTDLSPERAALLRGCLTAMQDEPAVRDLLSAALLSGTTPPATRAILLEVLGRIDVQTWSDSARAAVALCLNGDDPALLDLALATLRTQTAPEFLPALTSVCARDDLPDDLRLSALATLARAGGELTSQQVAWLLPQLADDAAPLARLTAAEALGAGQLSAGSVTQILPAIAAAGPLELPVLVRALREVSDRALAAAALAALEQSPGRDALAPGSVLQLMPMAPEEVQTALADLARRLQGDAGEQAAKLAALEPVLPQGDAERGRLLFQGSRAACAACHRVGEVGGRIGPELTRVGQVRSPRDLAESILFPSNSFARGYESFTIQTADGRIVSGVISRETSNELELQTTERVLVRVPRSEIEQLAPSKLSIMPQGLDRLLTPAEISDLVAYLRSLK